MLSYENNPPDLLKSIGKSINSSHENITGDHNSLPEVEHQLISSSSVVQVHDKFSIRDFVFCARNKDIRTNWPFSDKHLKLCLKHGVKDVLPPFQSKSSKRKQFSTICLDNNNLGDDGNITRIPDENASSRVNSPTMCSLGDVVLTQKATANRLEVNFDQPDRDGGFPSSDTSNSQAYPSISGSTFKHHKFPKTVAKTSANKCNLVVKFGIPSFHSLNEEIMPHKTNLSDSPAFKVCPVCKMFSSSSNTTLNAHIDQCLSMETTYEGMAYTKFFTKCKVKPRKMRSMVDIYTTALVCTIEDLDRRNGSSWATDLSLPAQNIGVNSSQGNKKQMTSFTEPDIDANGDSDDGGVYIDANGRKLRILSKMDSFSSVVTTKEDCGSRRPQTRKILSGDQKIHHKYLKPAVPNKKFLVTTAKSSEVPRSRRPSNDSLLSSHFQIKKSRDTDELEKFRDKGTHQHPGRKLRSVQRSTFKNQKSRLGTSSPEFYTDSTSLNESRKRMKSSDYIHISRKRFLGAKETGLPMSKDDTKYEIDRNGHKRLKKSTECIIGKHSTWKPLKQFNRSEEEIVDIRPSHPKCAGSTKHVHQFLQKSSKLCKDNTTSLGIQALCSTNEEDQMQVKVDEEEDDEDEDVDDNEHATTWQSESRVIRATIPENTKNQTIKSSVNESEQERRAVSQSSKDGALNMYANSCDELFDNLDGSLSSSKVAKTDILTDTHMSCTAERTMRSFIRSMNPDIHDRADSYKYQSSPLTSKGLSTEPDSEPCPPDQVLSDEVSNYNIKELEPSATRGNACSDIGPIPIPGPPGSFLPSPGNGETEDHHGNSSLTVSLNSHEQQGGNSLESPNSLVSLTSNLAAETSEKAAETFSSTGTHVIPDSSLSDFPIPISEVSIVEAPLFCQALKVGARRSEFSDQKSYVKLEDNNQPCCCSRRERVQQGNVVDYQVSQILRRRAIPALVLPAKEMSGSLNTEPNYSCAGSDIYSLSSSSSFQVEAIPVFKRPSGFASPKNSDTINASKFHTKGDSESASPSAVIRLMGKNLMVAKNDEDYSDPLGDAAASDTNTQKLIRKAASSCKPPNQSYCFQSQSAVPPDPAINSPSYRNMGHTFDFRMPNGPWGRMNFPRPDETNHLQAPVSRMHDMHMNSSGPEIDHKWPVQQCLPKNGFDVLHHEMHRGASLSIDFRKPIDAGSEVSALKNGITVTNCLNGTGTPVAAEPDQPRLIYPIYRGFRQALPSMPTYLQQGSRNTCFPVPFSSGRSLNPQVKYLHNDSYVLHGHGMASSPSTHQKPGLFYTLRLP